MTFLKVVIPKSDTKDDKEKDQEQTGKGGDQKETIAKMKQFFESIHSIYNDSFTNLTNNRKVYFFLNSRYIV